MSTALIIILLILGVVLLALEIVALPGGVAGFFGVLFMKSKTWQRFSLNEEVDSKVNQLEPAVKNGTRGVTISRLAPTGKALIDGQQMEVHAVNKFIDPDRSIEVVATEGYRIDVREVDDKRFEN